MEILDSGSRRIFKSGAVRDIQENKGRCDLLPLAEVAYLLNQTSDKVLEHLNVYVREGDVSHLFYALVEFIARHYKDVPTAILEVAKHYEEGALKYKERNWEGGIDLHCYIDSGIRHYLKFLRGDKDEPHDRAVIWNLLGAIWTHKNRPECIDLPFNTYKENEDG